MDVDTTDEDREVESDLVIGGSEGMGPGAVDGGTLVTTGKTEIVKIGTRSCVVVDAFAEVIAGVCARDGSGEGSRIVVDTSVGVVPGVCARDGSGKGSCIVIDTSVWVVSGVCARDRSGEGSCIVIDTSVWVVAGVCARDGSEGTVVAAVTGDNLGVEEGSVGVGV